MDIKKILLTFFLILLNYNIKILANNCDEKEQTLGIASRLDLQLALDEPTQFYLTPLLQTELGAVVNQKTVSITFMHNELDRYLDSFYKNLVINVPLDHVDEHVAFTSSITGGYHPKIITKITEGIKINYPPTDIRFIQQRDTPVKNEVVGFFEVDDAAADTIYLDIVFADPLCQSLFTIDTVEVPFSLIWQTESRKNIHCDFTVMATDQGNLKYQETFDVKTSFVSDAKKSQFYILLAILVPVSILSCFVLIYNYRGYRIKHRREIEKQQAKAIELVSSAMSSADEHKVEIDLLGDVEKIRQARMVIDNQDESTDSSSDGEEIADNGDTTVGEVMSLAALTAWQLKMTQQMQQVSHRQPTVSTNRYALNNSTTIVNHEQANRPAIESPRQRMERETGVKLAHANIQPRVKKILRSIYAEHQTQRSSSNHVNQIPSSLTGFHRRPTSPKISELCRRFEKK